MTTSLFSDDGSVDLRVNGGIATIRFGHPKSNALPGTLLRSLASTIEHTGTRHDVRVIVLRSEGSGAFCAGASFDELAAIDDPGTGREFFLGFARVMLAMVGAPMPIVTAVQGKVVGGGVGVVAASDYAIAVDKASLKLSELAVGIGPFVVGPVIVHKIGLGAYGAMALDADWRDAAWAERHGLYAHVVADPTALDVAVAARAQALAASNPDAVRAIKRVLWEGTADWEILLEERAATSGALVLSEFTREAIRQFKRG
ncbi:MAG: enoyl-CoA hydratase/isomerase family protein [Gemmatimonadetes bacterium]|nr:enoyl-CoA hydratase/isomerase family protein [Gemmatimonadota bacterium]